MSLRKNKRFSTIILIITFVIISWFLFELILKGFDVVNSEYGIDPKVFIVILIGCEIIFDVGIVLMILGSGVLKLRLRHVFKLNFRDLTFENELVYTGFTINRIAALIPPSYLIAVGGTKLPTLVFILLIVEIIIVLFIATLPIESEKVFNPRKISIRTAKKEDLEELVELEKRVWGKQAATREMITARFETFLEGIFVATQKKRIVGVVFTEIISRNYHNWYEYTDNGYIKKSHDLSGSTLFGVGLSVLPEFGNQGVGTKLLLSIADLIIIRGLKKGILGGRIPDFHKYKNKYSVEEYIFLRDSKGALIDPEVRFYKKAGLKIKKILPNYFRDSDSCNYGLLLEWKNPFFSIRSQLLRKILANIFKVGFIIETKI